MELVGFIVVAALGYIIFLGVKFSNFKSKLMNEFGRQGVPFEIADDIFFRERNEINNLHHSGMPMDQIVDRYLAREGAREASPRSVGTNLASGDEVQRNTMPNEKSSAIIEFVAQILGVQQMLFMNEEGTLPVNAYDNWSIGYVAGTADAVLQKNGFETDVKGMALMTLIFVEVFGERGGPEFFGKFLRLQEQKDQDVQDGMATGGTDVWRWMSDNNKVPMG